MATYNQLLFTAHPGQIDLILQFWQLLRRLMAPL
jgi:hypothetical protein